MITFQELLRLEGVTEQKNDRRLRKLKRQAARNGVSLHHFLFQRHRERLKNALHFAQPNAVYEFAGIRYLVEIKGTYRSEITGRREVNVEIIGYLKSPPVEAPRMLFGFLRPGTELSCMADNLKPVQKLSIVYTLPKFISYNIMCWELAGDTAKAESWKQFGKMFLPKPTNPTDGPLLA